MEKIMLHSEVYETGAIKDQRISLNYLSKIILTSVVALAFWNSHKRTSHS